MEISMSCMSCLIDKATRQLEGYHDGRQRECMAEILKMMGSLEAGVSAPLAVCRMEEIIRRFYPGHDSYTAVKKQYNEKMMAVLPKLQRLVEEDQDPLAAAVRYALQGNYIDFGAMSEVDDELLQQLIHEASDVELRDEALERFRSSIYPGVKVAYLHDNCGEIVLDTLLIEELKKRGAQVISIVRGAPVVNDATLEDAEFCQLQAIGNGTAIAGTELSLISPQARAAIEESDLIISKGQGNFETIFDHGLPIWYLFLCKCDYFTRRFGLEKYKPVFNHEDSIRSMMR